MQVSVVDPVTGRLPQLQPAAVTLLIRILAGTVSVTTRSPENALGPPFVTVNVHENGMSTVAVAGEGPVCVSWRSAVAALAVTVCVALLLLALPLEVELPLEALQVRLLARQLALLTGLCQTLS